MLNATDIMPLPFIPSSDTILEQNESVKPQVKQLHQVSISKIIQSKSNISTIMHSDCTPQAQRTAYVPPTSHRVKRIRINSINTDQIIPDPPFIPHSDVPTTIRAQIDTGADLTCTNLIEILHDYSSYNKSFPCRIKLVGAVDSNDGIYPLGEGYIHVPASTKQEYVRI